MGVGEEVSSRRSLAVSLGCFLFLSDPEPDRPGLSHHVGVLVLQLVQLFALLPQKQDSADGKTSGCFQETKQNKKRRRRRRLGGCRAKRLPGSPLFAQRGLNFTHSDQRAEVLHLSADLRHVQAAHVVEVLVGPSRLAGRDEPPLTPPAAAFLFPS